MGPSNLACASMLVNFRGVLAHGDGVDIVLLLHMNCVKLFPYLQQAANTDLGENGSRFHLN